MLKLCNKLNQIRALGVTAWHELTFVGKYLKIRTTNRQFVLKGSQRFIVTMAMNCMPFQVSIKEAIQIVSVVFVFASLGIQCFQLQDQKVNIVGVKQETALSV